LSATVFLTSGFFLIKNIGAILPARASDPDFLLSIPAANLSDASVLVVEKQGTVIPVPERDIGKYSPQGGVPLLVGHSSGIFKDLDQLKIGDQFTLDNVTYEVKILETLSTEDIDMNAVLYPADPEIALTLMTCAGDYNLFDNTYAERLIIYAVSKKSQ
jgi:hypothetical protein